MVKSIVIGLGETGGPLLNILGCDGYDIKSGNDLQVGPYDVMNVCIPYSEQFIDKVKWYKSKLRPKIIIIHSTVPIGTTKQIENTVHSPILGKHDNMELSIKQFVKWVGGEKAEEAAYYLESFGLSCHTVKTSDETEALKLMCLMTYGVSIALAQYRKKIADAVGFSYLDILKWDRNYNDHVAEYLNRPLITPPGAEIGGHCIIQNMPYLYQFLPSLLIEEILKFKPVTRAYGDNLASV